MTKEIKEILDKLKDSVDNPIIDVPTYDGSDSEPMDNISLLEPNTCKQLLDYITNLQQENEFLKLNNPEQNMEHFRIVKENKRKIDNLRKENERLKNLVNPKTQIFIDTQDMEERYGQELYEDYLKEQLEDYKSRCEKAIEYIKMYKCDYSPYELTDSAIRNVINILNGSDEE